MVWKLVYNFGLFSIQVSYVILALVYMGSPEVIDLYNFMMFMLTIVSLDLVCWSVYENLATCKCDTSEVLDDLHHNAHKIFSMLTLIAGILFFTLFSPEIGVIVLSISTFIKIVTICTI